MNNCYKYNYKYNQFNNNCANYIYKLLYRYLHLISDKVSIWGSYCQFYCHLVHIDKFTHSKFFNVVYFSSPSVFPSIADDMFNYKRVDIMKIIIIFHYHYHPSSSSYGFLYSGRVPRSLSVCGLHRRAFLFQIPKIHITEFLNSFLTRKCQPLPWKMSRASTTARRDQCSTHYCFSPQLSGSCTDGSNSQDSSCWAIRFPDRTLCRSLEMHSCCQGRSPIVSDRV